MWIFTSRRLLRLLSFNFASAMALYPVILVKHKALKNNAVLINHEKIHLRQQIETGILLFYLWYLLEYLVRLGQYRRHRLAYENISFEREAFAHEHDLHYLRHRKPWRFLSYLRQPAA